MHEEFLTFVGAADRDVHLAFPSEDKFREFAALLQGIEQRSIVFPRLQPSLLSGVAAVRLVGEAEEYSVTAVSDFLEMVPSLQFLELPQGLFGELGETLGQLSSLTTLKVVDQSITKVPSEFQSKSLRRLIAGRLRTTERVVENLEHLDVAFDSKMAKLLQAASQLKTLNMRSLSAAFDFAVIPAQLSFLGLRSGRLDSLEGIGRIMSLRGLWLQELNNISLQPVVSLPQLEELTIGYCKNLRDVQALGEVRSLKAVHIFGCGLGRSSIEALLPRVKLVGVN